MKNQNESFEDELIRRLRNYSEEPRLQLWQNIIATTEAQRRPGAERKRTRTGWILLLGMLTVGGLYWFERTNVNMTSSLVSSVMPTIDTNKENKPIDNSSASIPKQQSKKENLIMEAIEHDVNSNSNTTKIVLNSTSEHNSVEETLIDSDITVDTPAVNNTADYSDTMTSTSEADVNKVLVAAEGITRGDAAADKENQPTTKVIEKATVVEKKSSKDEGKTVIKEKDSKHNKLSIYFTIMPTFGYQRINSNSSDGVIIESIEKISAFSTDRLGVRAELGVEDPIARRIKVFGGLVYFQRKQTINYTEKQVEETIVTEGPNGEIIVDPQYKYVDKSFEYELKNLGVQLGVSYELSRKKLLQTIGTGFEFHIALNKLEDQYKAEFTNNPSAYVFYNLYYRLQYPAETRLKAVFQPTLNYSFYINQNVNAPFYVKPYGLGLNIGFTYNF